MSCDYYLLGDNSLLISHVSVCLRIAVDDHFQDVYMMNSHYGDNVFLWNEGLTYLLPAIKI